VRRPEARDALDLKSWDSSGLISPVKSAKQSIVNSRMSFVTLMAQ